MNNVCLASSYEKMKRRKNKDYIASFIARVELERVQICLPSASNGTLEFDDELRDSPN